MIRRLVNFLATISLLLAFTAVVFWVRSYQSRDSICYGHPNDLRFYHFASDRGLLIFESMELPDWLAVDFQRGLWACSQPIGRDRWLRVYDAKNVVVRWGVIRASGRRGVWDFPISVPIPPPVAVMSATSEGFAIPFWTVTGLLFLLPIARFASAAQSRRRQMKGLCPKCGYDLRESPDRCPECGTAVE